MFKYIFFLFIFMTNYSYANREGDMSDPSAFIPEVKQDELKLVPLEEAQNLIDQGNYE